MRGVGRTYSRSRSICTDNVVRFDDLSVFEDDVGIVRVAVIDPQINYFGWTNDIDLFFADAGL